MKIQCSNCKSNYNISEKKVPGAGGKIKCPKCQNIIALKKPKQNTPVSPVLSAESIKEAPINSGHDKADKKVNRISPSQHSKKTKDTTAQVFQGKNHFENPGKTWVKKFKMPYADQIIKSKLKIALAAICVIFALIAIKVLFEDDIKFSETEIRQWEKSGFHIDEARDWKGAGFSPSKAGKWREESFSPKEAKEWRNGGFEVRYAAKWKPVASNLKKTKELLASGFDRNRPEDVVCFSDKGFSFDDIKQLKVKTFKCDQAFEWLNNGFTTDHMIALSDLGFNRNDIRYAKEWQNAGFSPDEIVELAENGFQKNDVNKAKKLKENGYSTEEIANLGNSDTSSSAKSSKGSVAAKSEVSSSKRNSRAKDNIKNNKYAKVFTKEEQEPIANYYKSNIKSQPIIMDYLNLYVDNPQTLYNELVKSECDPEILEFVKHNKEFTLAYFHFGIVKAIANENITDAQLMFVTSYIKSPTALAATNQMEMTMETQLMRGSLLFALWEKITAPGGFKEIIEGDFNNTYEIMVNKDNGNSQKG